MYEQFLKLIIAKELITGKPIKRFIMLKKFVLIISLIGLIFLSSNAGASSFNFSFTGSGISGTGILTDLVANADGTFLAGGGSVIVNDGYHGGLVLNLSAPDPAISGDGLWAYDDILYPTAPFIDNLGLLFSSVASDGTVSELNIYNNSSPWTGAAVRGTSENYVAQYSVGGSYLAVTPVAYVPTPIPPALLLLGPGLIGLAGLRRKFQK
jgi:hypothetical protein